MEKTVSLLTTDPTKLTPADLAGHKITAVILADLHLTGRTGLNFRLEPANWRIDNCTVGPFMPLIFAVVAEFTAAV